MLQIRSANDDAYEYLENCIAIEASVVQFGEYCPIRLNDKSLNYHDHFFPTLALHLHIF